MYQYTVIFIIEIVQRNIIVERRGSKQLFLNRYKKYKKNLQKQQKYMWKYIYI